MTAAQPASLFCDDRYDRRKVLYHPRAIADLLETGDTWPVTVNTGFTTYCNHSCAWCSTAYTTRVDPSLKERNRLIIDPELWIATARTLAVNGTSGLIIAGQGEPLLHPKAAEMLEAAAEAGLRTMIFSNGERMGRRFHDAMFASTIAVRFSVDAASAAMHRRWHAAENASGRGSANWERVLGNIALLCEEKRRRGLELPHIGCQMIASSLTEPDFEAFARLFREVGVDYVVYKSLQGNPANFDISLSARDLHADAEARAAQARAMLETLEDIRRRYDSERFRVHVKVDQIEQAYVHASNSGSRYPRCRAHPLTPMIEPDGNVYLCVDHGGDADFVIGNIYDDPIEKIWVSERRRAVIESIDLDRCPAGCFLDQTNLILQQLAEPAPALHHALI